MDAYAPGALWMGLAALASLVALVQTARLLWGGLVRAGAARALRARARRAVEGESQAEPLLRGAGYEVVARQVPGRWTIYADGEPQEVPLRADLLVERDGRRYVAEVKTGRVAPRLDHAATRRQLLEYYVAFGVDGVLLVDADAKRVTVVELGRFEARQAREPASFTRWLLAFALGAAAATAVVAVISR